MTKLLGVLGLSGVAMSPLVLAQTAGQIGEEYSGFFTGSALTILATVCVGFIRGWIVSGQKYDKLEEKYDAVVQELRERNKDDRENFIPTLTRTIEAFTRIETLVREHQKDET